jgi:hypothetical protein
MWLDTESYVEFKKEVMNLFTNNSQNTHGPELVVPHEELKLQQSTTRGCKTRSGENMTNKTVKRTH